jgi:hypothetical protein
LERLMLHVVGERMEPWRQLPRRLSVIAPYSLFISVVLLALSACGSVSVVQNAGAATAASATSPAVQNASAVDASAQCAPGLHCAPGPLMRQEWR